MAALSVTRAKLRKPPACLAKQANTRLKWYRYYAKRYDKLLTQELFQLASWYQFLILGRVR
jgi:hypothetical protein